MILSHSSPKNSGKLTWYHINYQYQYIPKRDSPKINTKKQNNTKNWVINPKRYSPKISVTIPKLPPEKELPRST